MCKTKNTQTNAANRACWLCSWWHSAPWRHVQPHSCTVGTKLLPHCLISELWYFRSRCRGLGRFRVLFSFCLSQLSTRSFHCCGNLVHHIYLDFNLLTCFSNGFLQNLLLGHHPVSYNLFKLVSVWRVRPLLNNTHRCRKSCNLHFQTPVEGWLSELSERERGNLTGCHCCNKPVCEMSSFLDTLWEEAFRNHSKSAMTCADVKLQSSCARCISHQTLLTQ